MIPLFLQNVFYGFLLHLIYKRCTGLLFLPKFIPLMLARRRSKRTIKTYYMDSFIDPCLSFYPFGSKPSLFWLVPKSGLLTAPSHGTQ